MKRPRSKKPRCTQPQSNYQRSITQDSTQWYQSSPSPLPPVFQPVFQPSPTIQPPPPRQQFVGNRPPGPCNHYFQFGHYRANCPRLGKVQYPLISGAFNNVVCKDLYKGLCVCQNVRCEGTCVYANVMGMGDWVNYNTIFHNGWSEDNDTRTLLRYLMLMDLLVVGQTSIPVFDKPQSSIYSASSPGYFWGFSC